MANGATRITKCATGVVIGARGVTKCATGVVERATGVAKCVAGVAACATPLTNSAILVKRSACIVALCAARVKDTVRGVIRCATAVFDLMTQNYGHRQKATNFKPCIIPQKLTELLRSHPTLKGDVPALGRRVSSLQNEHLLS